MKKICKLLILVICLVIMSSFIVGCSKHESNEISFYNYGENIDDETIKEFEKKYNIKVNLTEAELISLTEELINVTKHQDARYKILPIRIIKRIVESAFAEAIYEEHSKVELEDFISAILDSNELKLKDKKEYALSIKNKLNSVEPQNNHSQNNKLYVLSSK